VIVTREKCQQIIDYNTIGKGKGNPNFTALTNAKIWLANLELSEREQGKLPFDTWYLNDATTLRMKECMEEEWKLNTL